jgi:hypothetical protein
VAEVTPIVLDKLADDAICICTGDQDEYWYYEGNDPNEVKCPVCRYRLQLDWEDILVERDLRLIYKKQAERHQKQLQIMLDSGEYVLMKDDYANAYDPVCLEEALKIFREIDAVNNTR